MLARVHDLLVELNNLLLIPVVSVITIDLLSLGLALPTQDLDGLEDLNAIVCVFFALEWLIGLMLSDDRAAYLRNPMRIADLVSSVPFGYFHSIRIIRMLRVLRLLRVVWRMRRLRGQMREIVRVSGLVTATAISGAVALRMVEPETVGSFGEAMWWSIVTMSTVGYGDISPVTTTGRNVAVTMIIVGIGIFGYAVSVLTSIMVDPNDDGEELMNILRRLEGRLERIEARLDRDDEA